MKSIAKENIPSRRVIKQRFDQRLGKLSKFFDPLSELLAEEAESIINETWIKPDPIKKPEPIISLSKKLGAGYTRHYCPNCRKMAILATHNFCPICGIQINWNSNLKTA